MRKISLIILFGVKLFLLSFSGFLALELGRYASPDFFLIYIWIGVSLISFVLYEFIKTCLFIPK